MKKDNYLFPNQMEEKKRTYDPQSVERFSFSMPEKCQSLGVGKQYWIKTYGCQANVRDGETIAGLFQAMQFTQAPCEEEADVIVFNTCAIRKAAEEHVFGEVGYLKPLKLRNPEKVFVVCGCMAQEESVVRRFVEQVETVDLIFGTHNIQDFPRLLYQVMKEKKRTVEVLSQQGDIIEGMPVCRYQTCKGYVHIMYGCNKFCTYCIVPYTRGKERSRKAEDILQEVQSLKDSGSKEVILLGQNVNAYGKDLQEEDGFTHLLEKCAQTGIDRIRFYTSHPRDYSETTIDVMQQYPNIMPALHLPVQSGDNTILQKMARGYTYESYVDLVQAMKKKIPSIALTTDIIVGFPGESDAQFQKTLDLVEACQFDAAYTFIYSPREGTPAAKMEDTIEMEVKKQRLATLNEKVGQIARKKNEALVGKTVTVLCEGASKRNPSTYSGYSEGNKLVNFEGSNCKEGEFVLVKITQAKSFSLDGIQVNPENE